MAEAKAPVSRPLSPHLQVYRWSWTMAMSIVHRVTGSALTLGMALLAIWLVALASGPRAFAAVQWFFGSPVGILVLFGYTWVLMHHMLGGVRHLVWDFGHGRSPNGASPWPVSPSSARWLSRCSSGSSPSWRAEVLQWSTIAPTPTAACARRSPG